MMPTVPVETVHAAVDTAFLRALAPREWHDRDEGGSLPWAVVGRCGVTFFFGATPRAPRRTKQIKTKIVLDSYEDEAPEAELAAAFEQAKIKMQKALAAHGIDHPLEFTIEPTDHVSEHVVPDWGYADLF